LIAKIRLDRKERGLELPLYLFSDASAAAGHVSLAVSRSGVDLLALNGGKIYGPKQSGALYVRAGTKLEPLILGGGQERGLRSGTESLAQAVGLATALELAEKNRPAEEKRYYGMRKILLTKIEKIPGFSLNNPQHSLPGVVNFSIAGMGGEDLVYKLDAAGFAVATGAACAATSDLPSHVLLAVGLSPDQANSSLRLSFGRTTNEAELNRFAAALKRIIG
jgi:cysteine desulfurase